MTRVDLYNWTVQVAIVPPVFFSLLQLLTEKWIHLPLIVGGSKARLSSWWSPPQCCWPWRVWKKNLQSILELLRDASWRGEIWLEMEQDSIVRCCRYLLPKRSLLVCLLLCNLQRQGGPSVVYWFPNLLFASVQGWRTWNWLWICSSFSC